MKGTRMEELRGTIRPAFKGPWDRPKLPALVLLDDIEKLQVWSYNDEDNSPWAHAPYPESHYFDKSIGEKLVDEIIVEW